MIRTLISDKFALVDHFSTAPEYRLKGIGSKLFSHMMLEMKKRGIKKIVLTTDTQNYVAQHVYQKNGFVKIDNPAIPQKAISLLIKNPPERITTIFLHFLSSYMQTLTNIDFYMICLSFCAILILNVKLAQEAICIKGNWIFTIKLYLKFPVIAILGPRQSGKTTLVKKYIFKTCFCFFRESKNT